MRAVSYPKPAQRLLVVRLFGEKLPMGAKFTIWPVWVRYEPIRRQFFALLCVQRIQPQWMG